MGTWGRAYAPYYQVARVEPEFVGLCDAHVIGFLMTAHRATRPRRFV